MRSTLILVIAIALSATLSCGHRTVSSASRQSQEQTTAVSSCEAIDSTVVTRRLNAVIRQPTIVVISRRGAGDTAVAVLTADEIIIGDSLKVKTKAAISATDSVSTVQSDREEGHETPAASSSSRAWMIAAFAAIAVLIVLSLRGIGSRR